MASINALFPSNFLKASDFPQPRVVTINRLEVQRMNDGAEKPVLFFNEFESGLVLNKTNANRIAEFLGDNFEGWPRCNVELYTEMVDFQGKRTPAIRARAPQQGGYYQQPVQQQGYVPNHQHVQQGVQGQQPPQPYYGGGAQGGGNTAPQPPQQQGQQQQRHPGGPGGAPLDDEIPF